MKKLLVAVIALGILGASPISPASAAAKVTLSKSTDLAFEGEKVALTISDFPAKSGLYVFQCVQPANGGALPELRQCNSADQLWITSSGRGSFLPTATNISIRLVGKFATYDCTVDKCALFFQFDRLAADDRSEDQFIPLTFKSATGANPTTPVATEPVAQGIGKLRTSLRIGQTLALPVTSDKGVTVAYRLKSPKTCSLEGNALKAKRQGVCRVDAYAAPSAGVAMFAQELKIKVQKKK
jgi:hypothetical protein